MSTAANCACSSTQRTSGTRTRRSSFVTTCIRSARSAMVQTPKSLRSTHAHVHSRSSRSRNRTSVRCKINVHAHAHTLRACRRAASAAAAQVPAMPRRAMGGREGKPRLHLGAQPPAAAMRGLREQRAPEQRRRTAPRERMPEQPPALSYAVRSHVHAHTQRACKECVRRPHASEKGLRACTCTARLCPVLAPSTRV